MARCGGTSAGRRGSTLRTFLKLCLKYTATGELGGPRADIRRGLHSYIPYNWEILLSFFSKNNIRPSWLDVNLLNPLHFGMFLTSFPGAARRLGGQGWQGGNGGY